MGGTLDFDPSLDGYASGRGTSPLTVTGSPITIDATAVTVDRVNVDHGDVGGGPNVVNTYQLIPRRLRDVRSHLEQLSSTPR